MSHPLVISQLEQVELQVSQVSETLLDMSMGDLPQVCTALQVAIAGLAKLARQMPADLKVDRQLHMRMRKVAASLASCRESLIRRSVITQQALVALVPATRSDTYAPASGQRSHKSYGSAGCRSGEFRMVSA